MSRICVFCGASTGHSPTFQQVAAQVGTSLAKAGFGVVYGGGGVGLMGVIADHALAEGAEVIGVIPRGLFERELGHTGITALEVVDTMHERKARMVSLSDGFAILPGGFGTLDELFEVLTWAQLGLHNKPIVLLNSDGYFAPLLSFVQKAEEAGFVPKDHFLQVASTPSDLVTTLQTSLSNPRQAPLRRFPGELGP